MTRYIKLSPESLAKLPAPLALECAGEAHSNPYIDHCMSCAPRWGTTVHCSACADHPALVEIHSERRAHCAKVGTCPRCNARYDVTRARVLP